MISTSSQTTSSSARERADTMPFALISLAVGRAMLQVARRPVR